MKISEWASIAEIIGAVAVVISLLYVGQEVQRNTSAVKSSTHQAMMSYGREHAQLLIENPEFTALVMNGEQDPALLSEVDRRRFYEYATYYFGMWESTHGNFEAGLVDRNYWNAWDDYFQTRIKDRPGYERFFEDTRYQWNEHFLKHLAEIGLLAN